MNLLWASPPSPFLTHLFPSEPGTLSLDRFAHPAEQHSVLAMNDSCALNEPRIHSTDQTSQWMSITVLHCLQPSVLAPKLKIAVMIKLSIKHINTYLFYWVSIIKGWMDKNYLVIFLLNLPGTLLEPKILSKCRNTLFFSSLSNLLSRLKYRLSYFPGSKGFDLTLSREGIWSSLWFSIGRFKWR